MSSYWSGDKERRKEYAKEHYAKQKAEKEFLKKWKAEHPEEYANKLQAIEKKEEVERKAISEFREMLGGEYFKAVSVHVCPDLMCECEIREIPALHSPVMRTGQKCNECGQTYSALLYNVGHMTEDQHTCGKWGIFVMSPDQYKSSRDVDNLYRQWSNKVMLAGDGEVNDSRTYGHVTLSKFRPSKALFVVCARCERATNQGVTTFADGTGFAGTTFMTPGANASFGESSLICISCCGDDKQYPYAWEIRDWEMLFSSDHGFDWKEHYDGQKDELERKYEKYRNLLDGLNRYDDNH